MNQGIPVKNNLIEFIRFMRILFVHHNFPGQFKHLAPELVRKGHDVHAFILKNADPFEWQGVKVIPYAVTRGSAQNVHPWVSDFETKVIRAEACYLAANKLNESGFCPDVIIAHHGWGESLFLKNIWPNAKLGIYCEFFYLHKGGDVDFDPEFSSYALGSECRLGLKNLNNLLHFEVADAAISPTQWQASSFPKEFRKRITVVHDGIDTEAIKPDPSVAIKLNNKLSLTVNDEVITFVNRNLEPMRGYHIFMRLLPELLKQRPKARVLIIGGDKVSYGASPPKGDSWKPIFIDEVRSKIPNDDWSRVYFLGNVSYEVFISLLQLSTVHVYMTYPFVLSWSLIEAMSVGCAIVASDTKPLHEAIVHNKTGLLVDFFDINAWVKEIVRLLDSPSERKRLSKNARKFAIDHYDLRTKCLPRQIAWINELSGLYDQ